MAAAHSNTIPSTGMSWNRLDDSAGNSLCRNGIIEQPLLLAVAGAASFYFVGLALVAVMVVGPADGR